MGCADFGTKMDELQVLMTESQSYFPIFLSSYWVKKTLFYHDLNGRGVSFGRTSGSKSHKCEICDGFLELPLVEEED